MPLTTMASNEPKLSDTFDLIAALRRDGKLSVEEADEYFSRALRAGVSAVPLPLALPHTLLADTGGPTIAC